MFLIVFLFLRAIHPAYDLVRSSYVILLGFLTMALPLMVGAMICGRFTRNVADAYRKQQGMVEAADVSNAGVAATSFAIGLNNLRKRPLRTGLTVTALMLITFVMICFTSVRTDVVETQFPIGTAAYSGVLMRTSTFACVERAAEPLRQPLGESAVTSLRRWSGDPLAGELGDIRLVHATGVRSAEARATAVLGLSANEVDVTPIRATFDVLRAWHGEDDEQVCYLPRTLAGRLQIMAEDVAGGDARIEIAGRAYVVNGIFDD